jgi:hypothetical protein
MDITPTWEAALGVLLKTWFDPLRKLASPHAFLFEAIQSDLANPIAAIARLTSG